MTHLSKPSPSEALSKEEIQARYDKDRISYPGGIPDTHLTWINRQEYVGNELTYRGQQQKSFVTLANAKGIAS